MPVEPVVSVLMPAYNSARYIHEAVGSVLNQTFTDFELLVVDDGSTDSTLSILRRFEAHDKRLRLISRENRGLVASRNELIVLSRGSYLAILDSDDVCRPNRFERQVSYLNLHPECVAVGAHSLVIDSSGMPIIEMKNELTHEELDSLHISGRSESRICNSSVMLRKDAVIQVGRYREQYRFAEDFDLLLRLAEIGRLANIPEVLVEYRQHLRSVSNKFSQEQGINANHAVLAARKRRGLPVDACFQRRIVGESIAEIHRKWAWWALLSGNVATARKHAVLAFVRSPFDIENLKVFACAARGY